MLSKYPPFSVEAVKTIVQDMRYTRAWEELDYSNKYEPITDSNHIDDIVKNLIDGIKNREDRSQVIWELLIKSFREYFEDGIGEEPTARQVRQRINERNKPL